MQLIILYSEMESSKKGRCKKNKKIKKTKEGKCINQAQSLGLTGAVCRTYFSERRSLKCRATFLICALSFECF